LSPQERTAIDSAVTFLDAKGLVIVLDASRATVAAASKDNLSFIVVAETEVDILL
jgi:hypothetical protein